MVRGYYRRPSAEDRFWSRVQKGPECWEWQGSTRGIGYGRLRVGDTVVQAHRFSWQLHNGPIPDDQKVLHHCDNPPCVRPDHLFLGSNQVNTQDMLQKGRGRHSKKTHCLRGHLLSGDNLYLYSRPTGPTRQCRQCRANALWRRTRNDRGN